MAVITPYSTPGKATVFLKFLDGGEESKFTFDASDALPNLLKFQFSVLDPKKNNNTTYKYKFKLVDPVSEFEAKIIAWADQYYASLSVHDFLVGNKLEFKNTLPVIAVKWGYGSPQRGESQFFSKEHIAIITDVQYQYPSKKQKIVEFEAVDIAGFVQESEVYKQGFASETVSLNSNDGIKPLSEALQEVVAKLLNQLPETIPVVDFAAQTQTTSSSKISIAEALDILVLNLAGRIYESFRLEKNVEGVLRTREDEFRLEKVKKGKKSELFKTGEFTFNIAKHVDDSGRKMRYGSVENTSRQTHLSPPYVSTSYFKLNAIRMICDYLGLNFSTSVVVDDITAIADSVIAWLGPSVGEKAIAEGTLQSFYDSNKFPDRLPVNESEAFIKSFDHYNDERVLRKKIKGFGPDGLTIQREKVAGGGWTMAEVLETLNTEQFSDGFTRFFIFKNTKDYEDLRRDYAYDYSRTQKVMYDNSNIIENAYERGQEGKLNDPSKSIETIINEGKSELLISTDDTTAFIALVKRKDESYFDVVNNLIEKLNKLLSFIAPTLELNVVDTPVIKSDRRILEMFNGLTEDEIKSAKSLIFVTSKIPYDLFFRNRTDLILKSFPISNKKDTSLLNLNHGFKNSIVTDLKFDGDVRYLLNLVETPFFMRSRQYLGNYLQSNKILNLIKVGREVIDRSKDKNVKSFLTGVFKLPPPTRLGNPNEFSEKELNFLKEILNDYLDNGFESINLEEENKVFFIDQINTLGLTDDDIDLFYRLLLTEMSFEKMFPKVDDRRSIFKGKYRKGEGFVDIGANSNIIRVFNPDSDIFSLWTEEEVSQFLFNEKASSWLKNYDEAWQLSIKTLGIPELDTIPDISVRNILLRVKDNRRSTLHFLSGNYTIIKAVHTIDPKMGYICEFECFKQVAFANELTPEVIA